MQGSLREILPLFDEHSLFFTPFLSFDAYGFRGFRPARKRQSSTAVASPRIPKRCKYQQSKSGEPKRVGVQEKLADNQRECCSETHEKRTIATARNSRSRKAPQRNEQGHYRKRK
jgi:hypothetical protein